MSTDRKTSILVANQLSEYIRRDHPHFVSFLEAYYEWMENNGLALDLSKNLLSHQDIDTTLTSFITYFKKEYLAKLPEALFVDPLDSTRAVDKRKLIKNIREFYRARGTEKSYRFLFRILFDSEIDFYYPRVDMLKASDGKWFQDITIRTRQLTGNPFLWANQKVRGATSGASGFVENVQKISVGPLEVYEIFLNRSSILGAFLPNELIESDAVVGTSARTYHLLTGIKIVNPGEGYVIGDDITITQAGPGYGAKGRVENVDVNGGILKAKIIDYGAGYSSGIAPGEIVFPVTVTPASATAIIGGQTLYPGYYLNDDGKISDAKFIQDSYFYQQFSYVIKVGQSIETYRNIILELIHPAGLILFGEFFSQNLLDVRTTTPKLQPCSTITIKRHVGFGPHGLTQHNTVLDNDQFNALVASIEAKITALNDLVLDPIQQLTEGEIYDRAYNMARVDSVPENYIIQDYVLDAKADIEMHRHHVAEIDQSDTGEVSTFKLGPSLRSIERFKFTYLPSEGYVGNTDFGPANTGYYSQYANYQIRDFEDMKIYNFDSVHDHVTITLGAGSGTFQIDESVYQGANAVNAVFIGKVIGYNIDGTLVVTVLNGNISLITNIIGIASSASRVVSNVKLREHGLARRTNIMPEPGTRTSL